MPCPWRGEETGATSLDGTGSCERSPGAFVYSYQEFAHGDK